MDRDKCKAIRAVIDNALKGVGEPLGVKITIGGASYDTHVANFKIEFADIVAGQAMTKEVEAFKRMATLHGFQPEDLGKPFAFRRRMYKICGLKHGCKHPLLAERDDGKVYRFSADLILPLIGRKQHFAFDGFSQSLAAPVVFSGVKRPDAVLIEELRDVECQLSPENLCCDGELRGSAVAKKRQWLLIQQVRLEAELGRKPTDAELFPEPAK